VGVTSVII